MNSDFHNSYNFIIKQKAVQSKDSLDKQKEIDNVDPNVQQEIDKVEKVIGNKFDSQILNISFPRSCSIKEELYEFDTIVHKLAENVKKTRNISKLLKYQKITQDGLEILASNAKNDKLKDVYFVNEKLKNVEKEINKRINSSTPFILSNKKIKISKNHSFSLLDSLSKLINNIFKKISALMPFSDYDNVNALLGKYQQISKEDYKVISDLICNADFLNNFCTSLGDIEELLSDNNLKKIMKENISIDDNEKIHTKDPMIIFNYIIKNLIQTRNEQLATLNKGEAIVPNKKTDDLILCIRLMAASAGILQELSEEKNESLIKSQTIFSSIANSTSITNFQSGFEYQFLPTIIKNQEDIDNYLNIFDPNVEIEKRFRSEVINKRKFLLKDLSQNSSEIVPIEVKYDGYFLPTIQQYFHTKGIWETTSRSKIHNTFINGFRKVIFKKDDDHQIETQIPLDLSPLGIDLTKKQEALIFYYIFEYNKNRFQNRNDPEQEKNQLNEFSECIGLDESKKNILFSIIKEYHIKLQNAMTLLTLSAGHKKLKSNFS